MATRTDNCGLLDPFTCIELNPEDRISDALEALVVYAQPSMQVGKAPINDALKVFTNLLTDTPR